MEKEDREIKERINYNRERIRKEKKIKKNILDFPSGLCFLCFLDIIFSGSSEIIRAIRSEDLDHQVGMRNIMCRTK